MGIDGRKDRLWIVGGCLVAVVLAVAGWFLLIGPQRSITGERDTQAADARAEIPVLKKKLADLKKDNEKLEQYKLDLEKNKAALPESASIPEYLRLMQSLGAQAGVDVDTVTIGTPTLVTKPAGVYQIPVTLLVSGRTLSIEVFLGALQQVQPRAVLLTNVDVVPVESEGHLAIGDATATLTAQVFVTGDPAAPAQAPQADTAAKGTD